jgi:hypothetical protein
MFRNVFLQPSPFQPCCFFPWVPDNVSLSSYQRVTGLLFMRDHLGLKVRKLVTQDVYRTCRISSLSGPAPIDLNLLQWPEHDLVIADMALLGVAHEQK